MIEGKLGVLSQMMDEHMATSFPPGCRGLVIEDQDMVLLDADSYGCALGVLDGSLDEPRRVFLMRLAAVFEKVLPAIADEYAAEYYTHVRDMVALAADIDALRHE